jgi:BlaI family transcriptional regulator, penicillinase repressor
VVKTLQDVTWSKAMSKELPELTDMEWVIMRCCWQKPKCTARDVFKETNKQKSWQYQTVKTMLDRLMQKGYLRMEKLGPICLFEPAVSHRKAMTISMDSFVKTVLDGTLTPMFAHLTKSKKLSAEELDTLKKLIEQEEERQK